MGEEENNTREECMERQRDKICPNCGNEYRHNSCMVCGPLPNGVDPLVVSGAALAEVMQEEWARDEEVNGGGWEQVGMMGFMSWLQERTGIPQAHLNRYINGKVRWVTLATADNILSAMGRPDLLQSSVVPVPNPKWSLEKVEAYMSYHCATGLETDDGS